MMEDDASCTLEINITDEEVENLCEEIVQLQRESCVKGDGNPDFNSENYRKYERYRWIPSMFV